MPFAPSHAPRMLGWAADALKRGSTQAERLAHRLSQDGPERSTRSLADLARPVSRVAFEDAIVSALQDASNPDRTVSVIATSIDFFDVVTASHGTSIGQEVLDVAATRLREAIRTDDVMTRFGTDGFALLWAPEAGSPEVTEVADRIASQFDLPIMTTAGQLPITVSIGIASADSPRSDPATLQRQAQTAVLSAQRAGRAQLVVFDQELQARAIESYETERHLRAAVRNHNLGVAYQPIISLHSGAVVGIEALARWNDDSLGFVSPATFIPIAEESGLIGEIGRQILESAISQGNDWINGSSNTMMLTVNLSNRQLIDPELIPAIARLLDEHSLDPRHLCMEITESVVMSNVAASMTILGHMKDLGLMLAIDDFGTGYSSLSYLRRLPVDILKIDRSFVQAVYNRDDRMITKAIIDLAHTLGMTTIAEGVETQLQVEVLHALNCDMAQGFLLHPPTPANEVCFDTIDFENYPAEAGVTSYINGNHGSLSAPVRRADPFAPQ